MIGGLPEALRALLTDGLPGLLGGEKSVGLTVTGGGLEIDDRRDAVAGEPRPEDRVDDLAFDPGNPTGPYALAQPPYPGPRRVWLVTEAGDRIPLRPDEVAWDETDARRFSLGLWPRRDVSTVVGVRLLYGVLAVSTEVGAAQALEVRLAASDAGLLEKAESLVVAAISLGRNRLVEEARASYEDGDYEAAVELKNLVLVGSRPDAGARLLTLRAELELRAGRALGEDEGGPIERIRTMARPLDPGRPVDVFIDVES